MEQSLKDRLTAYLSAKRISNTEFCSSIGASKAYISSIRKAVSLDKLEAIWKNYPDLNIMWLLFGVGEMLSDAPQIPTTGIPLVDGEMVAAGALRGYGDAFTSSDITDYIQLPTLKWMEGDFAIVVRGRSMLDAAHPERNIPDGAIACLHPLQSKVIQWGEVYCIGTADGYAIKRLMPADDDDCIKCVSNNEAEGYAPYNVEKRDITAIAKVTAIVSLQLL